MPPLERQASFASAVLDPSRSVPRGLRQPARFAIYRNNVFAGLRATLKARFPVTCRLLGDDCFGGCALRFIAAHPPTSPVIHDYGAGLVDFLTVQPELAALAYLPDVARLEWARHLALHAADTPVLLPQDLADIGPERVGDLVFRVHPSVQLLRSSYPIHMIWQTNTFDTETIVIPVDAAGETVLISRLGDEVAMRSLSPADASFVAALFGGAALGAAAVESIDVAVTLATLLQMQAFTDFVFLS